MHSRFPNLAVAEVAKLRASDQAVEKLRELRRSGKRPNFRWLRASFGLNRDVWNELGRGTAVLSSTSQLDQYLYSYGLMVASQWDSILASVPQLKYPTRLVDYGCGQGLASLLLYDKYGDRFFSNLTEITLVEPSSAALVRAEALYRAIAPTCNICCLNSRFDDLAPEALEVGSGGCNLHIFSNVLDVSGFDQFKLFNKILVGGRHTVCAVSHNREFDGGSSRIREIKNALDDPRLQSWLSVHSSSITEFTCGNGGKFPAISWIAELSVSRG